MCTTSCFNALVPSWNPLLVIDYAYHLVGQNFSLTFHSLFSKKRCSRTYLKRLLVECMVELLPVITLIINLSLQSGHFPEVWKEAIVIPLLKKCGSDSSNFKKLRPVSNLSYISNLTESAVADQIQSHLDNLYPVFQSTYRKLHSTETALVKVHNDILTNKNT